MEAAILFGGSTVKATAVDYTDSSKYSEKSGLHFKNLI